MIINIKYAIKINTKGKRLKSTLNSTSSTQPQFSHINKVIIIILRMIIRDLKSKGWYIQTFNNYNLIRFPVEQ